MNTQKQASQTLASPVEKKGFTRATGLIERYSNWREARSERNGVEREMRHVYKDAVATLAYVYANPRAESEIEPEEESGLRGRTYPAPKECIKEAADSFYKLDAEHKQQVLAFITTKLNQSAPYAIDRLEESESVIAITASISEIAKRLPVDERGNKNTTGFETAVSLLTKLANEEQLIQIDPDQYASMRLACTAALWDLDYGDANFWEERLGDDVTKSLTIGRLLEMPPTQDPESHGWSVLRPYLANLAIDIARHESMKKFDFLVGTLVNGKEPEAVEALRAAALVPIPRFIKNEQHPDYQKDVEYQKAHFTLYDTIASLSDKRPISEDMAKLVLTFTVAVDAQIALTYGDDRQFIGVMKLLQIYNADQGLNRHLKTLILEAGEDMIDVCREPALPKITPKRDPEKERRKAPFREQKLLGRERQKALHVLINIYKAGITVPGLIVNKVVKKAEKPKSGASGEKEAGDTVEYTFGVKIG